MTDTEVDTTFLPLKVLESYRTRSGNSVVLVHEFEKGDSLYSLGYRFAGDSSHLYTDRGYHHIDEMATPFDLVKHIVTIRVGSAYRNRHGHIFHIIKFDDDESVHYPFMSEEGQVFTAGGFYIGENEPHDKDLVEEISAEAEPVPDSDPMLNAIDALKILLNTHGEFLSPMARLYLKNERDELRRKFRVQTVDNNIQFGTAIEDEAFLRAVDKIQNESSLKLEVGKTYRNKQGEFRTIERILEANELPDQITKYRFRSSSPKGSHFYQLYKENGECASKDNGGDQGAFDLVSLVEETVIQLEEGVIYLTRDGSMFVGVGKIPDTDPLYGRGYRFSARIPSALHPDTYYTDSGHVLLSKEPYKHDLVRIEYALEKESVPPEEEVIDDHRDDTILTLFSMTEQMQHLADSLGYTLEVTWKKKP